MANLLELEGWEKLSSRGDFYDRDPRVVMEMLKERAEEEPQLHRKIAAKVKWVKRLVRSAKEREIRGRREMTVRQLIDAAETV